MMSKKPKAKTKTTEPDTKELPPDTGEDPPLTLSYYDRATGHIYWVDAGGRTWEPLAQFGWDGDLMQVWRCVNDGTLVWRGVMDGLADLKTLGGA